ncbi:hypothetical protein BK727_27850 [Bacillus thuringiensis serovar roskildiensis]|uniref:Uncharacterized protein n=1 Tax=Bacillus thuringiensis serovar sooncheon TaxID=180891 RepID=A0A9Q5X3C5_BACTU|nr:hypothetical protein [Bacillus thuringiensis]OTW69280.1 hypothetical protein BK707_14940 [Bacillus thuringiensis serovar coreanensis]OTX45479.1 hypothetical protein BK724_12555 [Bacillus thuringiensis serovar sooncheon]OTX48910.1 hypothetical protein BK725_25465 [Bacillus thuringiensis serovar guiyangiensis]OTX63931.1 hypothetical protein BK727_27850 [Bacillus thuringiensis serovar roskildiensis]
MKKTSTFSYILTKLTATFLLLLLISTLLLTTNQQTLYSFLAGLRELLYIPVVPILAAYAIFCSICIDELKLKTHTRLKTLCLYIFCGYLFSLPFLIFKEASPIQFLFLGSIGAVCSLFFYLCTVIATKFKWIQYFVPGIMLIIFITINLIDLEKAETSKEQWVETKTDNSFEASFQHFSGEHKVPIELKRGDILEFTIESRAENKDGYMGDVKMASEFQEEENYLASVGPNTYHFAAIKTGTYYIIVSGNQLKGKLKINWNIK